MPVHRNQEEPVEEKGGVKGRDRKGADERQKVSG